MKSPPCEGETVTRVSRDDQTSEEMIKWLKPIPFE